MGRKDGWLGVLALTMVCSGCSCREPKLWWVDRGPAPEPVETLPDSAPTPPGPNPESPTPTTVSCAQSAAGVHYAELGTGSADAPYQLFTAQQLASLAEAPQAWSQHFVQCADIDLAAYYGPDRPYFSIGADRATVRAKMPHPTQFTGSFHGNGFAVWGFRYDDQGPHFRDPATTPVRATSGEVLRSGREGIGLFGAVGPGARFHRVVLKEAYVRVTDGRAVGLLIGEAWNPHPPQAPPVVVTDCTVEGTVQGYQEVGGLAGAATHLSLRQLAVEVQAFGGISVGGVVGRLQALDGQPPSSVREVVGKVSVHAGAQAPIGASGAADVAHLGGAVGFAEGMALGRVRLKGNVFADWVRAETFPGQRNVGGLVGFAGAGVDIDSSHFEGAVEATGGIDVGGLVGALGNGAALRWSFFRGEVQATASVGGLVGKSSGGRVADAFAQATVRATSHHPKAAGALRSHAGVAVGALWNGATVERIYATGLVEGEQFIGGLIGSLNSGTSLTDSAVAAEVTISNPVLYPELGTVAGRTSGALQAVFFWSKASCPAVCNSQGTAVAELAVLWDPAVPPLNTWSFSPDGWRAVPASGPELPRAQ